MKHFAKVADKQFILEPVGSDALTSVLVNGKKRQIDLKKIENNLYSLLIDNRSFQMFVVPEDDGYMVALNGRKHFVELEDEKARFLRKLIKKGDKQKGRTEVKAPMPGLIVKINVKEGQQIQQNDSLLIIEAMKMENEIRSEGAGVVKKIQCKEKDSVDKGTVLMLMMV